MKRLIGLTGACALVLGTLALTLTPVRVQAAQQATITFTLTINGTPAAADNFAVGWGETGLQMCTAPCAGDGHSYVRTMTFPTGVTETFVFSRAAKGVTPENPAEKFAEQTVMVNSDQGVSGFFTYGTAAVPTPSTGSAPPVAIGAGLVASGGALVLLIGRRRRGPRAIG